MSTAPLPPVEEPALVVIGNFDGVHRGHQAVLRTAVREAEERGLVPSVLTFFPHPAEVLAGHRLSVLTTLETKLELLRRLSPALRVIVEPFTHELARLSPREFAERVLVERLAARLVIVGENFRFGHQRAGDLRLLQELGRELGFEARAEPLVFDEVGAISSTRVREELARGDVRHAAGLLGRSHTIVGTVVSGDRRGRTIGFPTANLDEVREALPLDGIYSTWVRVDGEEERRPGVAHLGPRPTVDRPHAIEVHLLDFEGDLYGRRLSVEFVDRLRGGAKFASLDELKERIALDVAEARASLARPPEPRP